MPPSTPLHPMPRALIIGASSGMGAALARRLAREGYALALVARRKRLLTALCGEINRSVGQDRAVAYVHDVRNVDEVPGTAETDCRRPRRTGSGRVLLRASTFRRARRRTTSRATVKCWKSTWSSAFAWLDPIAAMFAGAGQGQIVGLSSVAGDRGRVGNPGYNASKAGFTSYLESLRNRLTRHGVNVLTVKAGFVQTEMLKAAQKVMFPITAERAADEIFGAIRRRKQQIYTPWFWSWIMLVVRNIPSFLFRRMSF